jgi:pilus assembly protein CpaD
MTAQVGDHTMTNGTLKSRPVRDSRQENSVAMPIRIALAATLALTLAGCKTLEEGTRVAGWELTDPLQRHPILVSQQPETLNIAVPRGANGLSPSQRSDVLGFSHQARASDAGNSRLVIAAPSGSSNETAAITAVHEIGALLKENGYTEAEINIEPFDAAGASNPPVKLSFLRFVAEGPECGNFQTNLARDPRNLPAPNFGCASQKNLAAMVVNPADLLGPRNMDARPSERRSVTWDKYIKGESSGAQKSQDEQVETGGE